MKRLATVGDNCVDIYPQLNQAFSGGNAVNVAVYMNEVNRYFALVKSPMINTTDQFTIQSCFAGRIA